MTKFEVRFIIEIAGKPIENVEKALKKVKDQIESLKTLKVVECLLEKPEFQEDTQLYGGFLDLEAKFTSPKDLLAFIFDYTPTSIEIIEPENIKFNSADFAGLLNDVSSFMLSTSIEKRKLEIAARNMHAKLQQYEGNK